MLMCFEFAGKTLFYVRKTKSNILILNKQKKRIADRVFNIYFRLFARYQSNTQLINLSTIE